MHVRTALAGVGALLAFAGLTAYAVRAGISERRALADSREARQAVSRTLARLAEEQVRNDSLKAAADLKLRAAKALHARIDTLRVAFESQAASAPDTCAPVIASARAALDTTRAENDSLRSANADLVLAYNGLRVSAITLADSARRLTQTTETLEHVVARKWYKPEIHITAGVGPRGADVVLGPSWRIF